MSSGEKFEADDLWGDRLRVERLECGDILVTCLMEGCGVPEVRLDPEQVAELVEFLCEPSREE